MNKLMKFLTMVFAFIFLSIPAFAGAPVNYDAVVDGTNIFPDDFLPFRLL